MHSCGVWTHTMPMLRKMSNVQVVECAIGEGQGEGQDKGLHDPNPNANGRLGKFQGVYIFVPLEPYKLVRTGVTK
ncbi:hypothetical protein LCGC14_2979000 [marine sediment metagenome]|uniref:Uncharacterized protein n=1 Tax=marine sediment metagenome TaxID=412755 RepID=A0A0F8XUN8_9ZZZZ